MELSNFIALFLIFVIGYVMNKYFLFFLNKNKSALLIDNQFKKPQAFHQNPTYRLGGLTIFITLIISFLYLFYFFDILYLEYISFCSLFFILGFSDDIKIYVQPKMRLITMIFFLLGLIIFNDFYIEKISLEYLEHLLKIDIFALFFVSLCFLFIINGCNLIDGFNGLLGIHSLIIFITLLFLDLSNESYFLYILFFINIIIFTFLIFNFPKAQLFLGDGGAYLIGTLLAISIIKFNNFYTDISSFFYCILLFYLFFEVFFSFFRKLFFVRQNPLLPDNKHLHMLLYKYLLNKNNNDKEITNYKVAIYINSIYLLLIVPGFVFMTNGLFCRIYFFFLLIVYTYFYTLIYKKTNKAIS